MLALAKDSLYRPPYKLEREDLGLSLVNVPRGRKVKNSEKKYILSSFFYPSFYRHNTAPLNGLIKDRSTALATKVVGL
jgi:hypothetical protein